jgi:hypothetical protein
MKPIRRSSECSGTARTEALVLTLRPTAVSSITVAKRTPDGTSNLMSSTVIGASSLSRAPLNNASKGSQKAASPLPPSGLRSLVKTEEPKSNLSSSSSQGCLRGVSSVNRILETGSAHVTSSGIAPFSLAQFSTA